MLPQVIQSLPINLSSEQSGPIYINMTIRPDAYLVPVDCAENNRKKQLFIDHVERAPLGSKIPMSLDVQWVDSAGNPTKRGSISGTIETIIEIEDEDSIVVFSTGERISLATFSE